VGIGLLLLLKVGVRVRGRVVLLLALAGGGTWWEGVCHVRLAMGCVRTKGGRRRGEGRGS